MFPLHMWFTLPKAGKYNWKLCFQLILLFRLDSIEMQKLAVCKARSPVKPLFPISAHRRRLVHARTAPVTTDWPGGLIGAHFFKRARTTQDSLSKIRRRRRRIYWKATSVFHEPQRQKEEVDLTLEPGLWTQNQEIRNALHAPHFPGISDSLPSACFCTFASLISLWSTAFSSVYAWPLHPRLTCSFSAQSLGEMPGGSGAHCNSRSFVLIFLKGLFIFHYNLFQCLKF